MTPEEKQRMVIAFVTEHYIESGQDSTVREIAEGLQWSEARVRNVMTAAFGCPSGLTSQMDARVSHSSDYPMFETGTHRVRVFEPTKDALRQIIVSLRKKEFDNSKSSV